MTEHSGMRKLAERAGIPYPGDKMPDGTIYAGTSPDTGKTMYATPEDLPLTMTFNEAVDYATKLDAHGHRDWRVPTKDELNVLFNNRAAIGSFNTNPFPPDQGSCYWCSTPGFGNNKAGQSFHDGTQYQCSKDMLSSVRLVR